MCGSCQGAAQLLRIDDGCCVAAGAATLGLYGLLHLMALFGVGGVERQRLRGGDGVHSRPLVGSASADGPNNSMIVRTAMAL